MVSAATLSIVNWAARFSQRQGLTSHIAASQMLTAHTQNWISLWQRHCVTQQQFNSRRSDRQSVVSQFMTDQLVTVHTGFSLLRKDCLCGWSSQSLLNTRVLRCHPNISVYTSTRHSRSVRHVVNLACKWRHWMAAMVTSLTYGFDSCGSALPRVCTEQTAYSIGQRDDDHQTQHDDHPHAPCQGIHTTDHLQRETHRPETLESGIKWSVLRPSTLVYTLATMHAWEET